MSGEGMVAVVRGLREEGLAVTLLQGNRQYNLLPNSTSSQRPPIKMMNVSTQQGIQGKVDTGTESAAPQHPQCDRDVQAVDGRYTSTYKTMHCNVRPTSPPVHLTEFPPQRPDLCPGHGNFIVGGAGSGATASPLKTSSAAPNYRGGLCWPDRGSVCFPRPSHEVDAFAKSLRKYPCLSPDRSSEVMERLVNYTAAKGLIRIPRNQLSPTRLPEPPSYNTIESKSTNTRSSRPLEPDVCIRAKKTDDPPARDRKRDEHDPRSVRGYDVRCVRDVSKQMRESVKAYTSYPYSHPVCPPNIVENRDALSCGYQNSSNSVNMEVQAAVQMLSKEVATAPRECVARKSVAVPATTSTTGEDNAEGESFNVEKLNIRTSIKSIQTNSSPSDTTLKPRKSAQTVFSTIDFYSTRNRTVVSRKTKSQEQIKLTKEELKMSLLELINEVSDSVSKNTIRDELIKKLFATTDSQEKEQNNKGELKQEKRHNYVPNLYPPVCDYVDDYQELVGKLKHCYGDSKHIVRSEISPYRISEYRQLDFVLKDWINNLNLKNSDRYMDRNGILNYVEDEIKELLKSWTTQDFDLKSEIVNILQEIPIEINKSYNAKSYLNKLVDVLLKRMRNVILRPQAERIRRKPTVNRSRKILTEKDIKDFIRAHLMDFFHECDPLVFDEMFGDLENEMVELTLDSIDCIRCEHTNDFMDEMETMLQDIGQLTDSEASYFSNIILQDLQEMLNNCHFNQTYMILNVTNSSGPYMNLTDNTDFSIGSIHEEDLNANLDRYTSELCIQINQWLDTLNIPRIKDSGFREVVVNDLAGDIVDRHKYVDLNHTDRDSAHDQLEALKYQIFKWINKLVGDENQETIGHADKLLQMINSVPVPMLVNPNHRNMGNTGRLRTMDGSVLSDSQSRPTPHSTTDQELQDQTTQRVNRTKPCCEIDNCSNTREVISNPKSRTDQKIQGPPGFVPPTDGNVSLDQDRQSANSNASEQLGSPIRIAQGIKRTGTCCGIDICSNNGKNTSKTGPDFQDHSRLSPPVQPMGNMSYNNQGQQSANVSAQGQVSPRRIEGSGNSSGRSFGPTSPNNPWGSKTYSSVFEPPLVDNLSQTDAMVPNQQSMYGPNVSINDGGHDRSGGIAPLSTSIKKINEDYDEYLKYWVKELPITAKTPAEQKTAETARLTIYNEIWKCVTKMKLDPNIFSNNQYYSQDFFEEEIERLLQDLPKSKKLDAAKPELKAQLLQKTIAMNNLIKSTNAPASFKQQLVDSIDNNLPERTPTGDEEDEQNEELEKQNLADFYILYTRYKNEDNVKATVHKKNFLKKLDEFLDKIKNRHNLVNMDKTTHANEIIDSIDKIPTPNDSTIKEEADDILLAIEVEHWIADISQNPNTASPLQKRATRDAIVKKIQEIAQTVCIYDNAFRAPLKAELTKYLMKLPIQESTNIEYMIDELANRFKNLSTSARRVSFQAPLNYEEFSRNMPAASSFQEMSEPGSSYLIVDGNIVKDPAPRSGPWVSDQPPIPEDEIEWLSMEQAQMPSIMRSRNEVSQNVQSPQEYFPNANHLQHSARTYHGDESMVRQSESSRPDSMHLQRYNPNQSAMPAARGYHSEENYSRNTGQAVPQEEIEWHSMQETQMPQRYIPNEGRMSFSRSNHENSHEVPGQFPHNAQLHFDPSGQGVSNIQGGEICNPPCCRDPACFNRGQVSQRSAPFSKPAAHSLGLRGPYGPGSPVRGNALQTSAFNGESYVQGSPGRNNQSIGPGFGLPNIQNITAPRNQMHLQGPNVAYRSQSLQGTNVQGIPVPYDQSVVPGGLTYNQMAPLERGGQPYRKQHCTTCPNVGQGQDLTHNANKQSFGPHTHYVRGSLGQMGPLRPNGAPTAHVGQELRSNDHGYEQTEAIDSNDQGYAANFNPNTSAKVQASIHSSTLNQTSQSPGPISAASQVPNQGPKPYNLRKVTRGGMGVLEREQVPGPSSRTPNVRVSTASNTTAAGALPGARTEAIQPGFYTPADRGIPMIDPHIRVQRSTAANKKPQVYCAPPKCLGGPLRFSTPCGQFLRRTKYQGGREGRPSDESDSDREGERCPCVWGRGRGRPKTDLNDGNEVEIPCHPTGYPYHY